MIEATNSDPRKVEPKHGWCLIERDPRETQRNGILLPDQAVKVSNRGTVISAAKDSTDQEGRRIPVEVVAGDKVIFCPNNIRPAEFKPKKGDPAEYVFVPYYSILAKVVED